jgi:hypothetical protein
MYKMLLRHRRLDIYFSRNSYPLMIVQYQSNPKGFAIGLGLAVAGAFLILVVRPAALRNEWSKMLTVMMGTMMEAMSEFEQTKRRRVMATMDTSRQR